MVHADALAILDAAHKVHWPGPGLNPAMKEFVREVEAGEGVTHEVFHSASCTLTETGFTSRSDEYGGIWYDPPPGRGIINGYTNDGLPFQTRPRDQRLKAIADACRMYVWAWTEGMLPEPSPLWPHPG